MRHIPNALNGEAFWQNKPAFQSISQQEFLDWDWQMRNSISAHSKRDQLSSFFGRNMSPLFKPVPNVPISTLDEFIQDYQQGLTKTTMAVRLTPYILSLMDFENPYLCPIISQFIPLGSRLVPDHPSLSLDSLGEQDDSIVSGLVRRYPERVLLISTTLCPVFCHFCTRSYAIGPITDTVDTKAVQRPGERPWKAKLAEIENDASIQDVVVSGGDCYMLRWEDLAYLVDQLLAMPHIRRIRFATKGLAVGPGRILTEDSWTRTMLDAAQKGRRLGKQVCIHTHINHPREITWMTKAAGHFLFQYGITVRNQTVLLRGVNDDIDTQYTLIKELADMNIQPYYVYQCDPVSGIEHLRTPLRTIINLEKSLRGMIAGFMMPQFVVDLPGGGGKRLASTFETYDEDTGESTWTAPGLGKREGKVYKCWDPKPSAH